MIAGVQDILSCAQSCCCIPGALFISPIKALFSLAQMIVGLAITVFAGAGYIFCQLVDSNRSLTYLTWTLFGLEMVGSGLWHAVYAILNIVTLGIAACIIENGRRCCFSFNRG